MNFIWVIIGVVYLIYQFNKEHEGKGYLGIIFATLGVMVAIIAVPQLIGIAVGDEAGQLIGGIIGFSVLIIVIIALFIYSRS